MRGIFRWVLSPRKRQSGATLKRLTDLMVHRGPDGSGYYLDESANGRFQIGLGHRRLSIIDIDGGAQPMWSADGTIALIFNGEIYNYVELRRELKEAGIFFAPTPTPKFLSKPIVLGDFTRSPVFAACSPSPYGTLSGSASYGT